jgi:ammonium transporter Rh
MAEPTSVVPVDGKPHSIEDKGDGNALKMDTIIYTVLLVVCQAAFFIWAAIDGMKYGTNDFSSVGYTMFIHVSIMIFFGFGFLMTFLRRAGYTAVGMCVITSVVAIQLSFVMSGILRDWAFEGWGGHLNLNTIINGLFCAAAVMISMGAVLGKVSPAQLILMGIIETAIYWVNMGIYFKELEAHDAAGGVVIHTFGAYFGLACARVISNPTNLDHPDNGSIYSSDLFSLAGTLFLWLLWPSFCAIVAGHAGDGALTFLAVTNTYMCLMGSTLGFAILSRPLHDMKFDVVELQNAILAGGVAAGVPADYDLGPAGALGLGLAAGVVSTLGYAKLNLAKIGLSDTCGVNNLHGMPGILSAIVGIAAYEAVDQILGLVVTLAFAIIGGILTGVILRFLPGGAKDENQYFNDNAYWGVPDDYKIN